MIENSSATAKATRRKGGVLKRLWRSIRGPLANSPMVRTMIVWLITQFFRLVHLTNPRLCGIV